MGNAAGNGPKDARPQSPVAIGLQAFADFKQPTEAVLEANRRLLDGMLQINKEWSSFVSTRLKEDLTVPSQLAACRTMQDMLGVYTGYWERAYTQYQSGLAQVARLSRAVAEDTVNAARLNPDATAKDPS